MFGKSPKEVVENNIRAMHDRPTVEDMHQLNNIVLRWNNRIEDVDSYLHDEDYGKMDLSNFRIIDDYPVNNH